MKRTPLIITLVILCTLLALGGVLWYEKNQEMQKESQNEGNDSALSQDEVWYPIPELGIKIKLNKEFAADLVYEYEPELAGIAEHSFGEDSNKQRPNIIRAAQFGRVYFSTKSLLNKVDDRCKYSARKAYGTLEKTPRVHNQDNNFWPEYYFPLGENGSNSHADYSQQQNTLFSNLEKEGSGDGIYKLLSSDILVSWYSYGDDFWCKDSKTQWYITDNINGTPVAVGYSIDGLSVGVSHRDKSDNDTSPPYHGSGAKNIFDAFSSIEPIQQK